MVLINFTHITIIFTIQQSTFINIFKEETHFLDDISLGGYHSRNRLCYLFSKFNGVTYSTLLLKLKSSFSIQILQ